MTLPGLLHTIATAISSVSVSIEAAQVATLGSDVVDVFYLAADGVPLNVERRKSFDLRCSEALADSDG